MVISERNKAQQGVDAHHRTTIIVNGVLIPPGVQGVRKVKVLFAVMRSTEKKLKKQFSVLMKKLEKFFAVVKVLKSISRYAVGVPVSVNPGKGNAGKNFQNKKSSYLPLGNAGNPEEF